MFADAFKTWRLQPAPGKSTAPSLDGNGWPQGDFGAFLWDSMKNTRGTYALRFTGQATVALAIVSGSVNNQKYDPTTNTTTATVVINQDSSAQLNFTNTRRNASSNPGTGVTNVQFMRPTSPGGATSYSFTTTFTDQIKQLISKFSVIRFVDVSAVISNGQVNWSDRRLPQEGNQQGPAHNSNTYGYEGLGTAWEYAIQLANETDRDAYINVPELATGSSPSDTNSYIYKLAQLFKYGSGANGTVYTSAQSNPVHPPLNSWRKLYIEYSNEIWNGAFAEADQNHDAAKAEVAAGNSPLNYDGWTSDWGWAWRRQAKRIKETSDIFRAVFGDSAMMNQVRPLLEWQIGNGQATAATELPFLFNYYNNGDGNHVSNPHPVNYYVWGGGGAVYTTVKNPNASTIDGIYNSGIDTTAFYNSATTDVNWGRAFGLHAVAYEGGFQIGGDNATDLQKQANLDARANADEQAYQKTFTQAGGELLMYYRSTGYNAYGLADPDVYSQNTPKLQAIATITQTNQAAFTNGVSVSTPVTVDGNSWNVDGRGWGGAGSGPLNNFGRTGNGSMPFVGYTIRNTDANSKVTFNYTSTISTSVGVYVTGTYWGTLSVSSGTNQDTGIVYFNMPIGVNSLLLVSAPGSDTFTINSVKIG